MKCIHCKNDCKYSERPGKRCPKCGHAFAFEPRSGDPITDLAFQAAIDRVSSSGGVRFGVEHLYYELCRLLMKTRRGPFRFLAFASLVVAGASLLNGLWLVSVISTVAMIASIRAHVRSPTTVVLSGPEFEKLWQRWLGTHGAPNAVIRRKESPHRKQVRPVAADIPDYSFDRAVICDRARTVDLLLANNFHFENNCAVLSMGGYPEPAFETVRAMLRKNPRLSVFALHDATPGGTAIAQRLATDPQWFKNSARVVDVGLQPRHARPFRGLWLASAGMPLVASALSADDREWLSHYSLELAAIRPEQVIKRLFRAIAKETDSDSGGDSDSCEVFVDADSFSDDASASDGGGDSFG